MGKWNGYRVGRTGGGGALNGYVAPKAKQAWFIGAIVNVGFIKDLLVTDRADGVWSLRNIATGKQYQFEPHNGLWAV